LKWKLRNVQFSEKRGADTEEILLLFLWIKAQVNIFFTTVLKLFADVDKMAEPVDP
jgi:hypothetical protein